ncbi:hypothetical protein DPMN_132322 [Dreissena polymorpha]|uniref:Uncharacterized protein n=1 Tax=Dreissena polymorpha TaxID=45954 RepID=A0A9D4FWI7_DREPO|nr:hypothetical protein DPMN_132322 [Dreissena polymorpha]
MRSRSCIGTYPKTSSLVQRVRSKVGLGSDPNARPPPHPLTIGELRRIGQHEMSWGQFSIHG